MSDQSLLSAAQVDGSSPAPTESHTRSRMATGLAISQEQFQNIFDSVQDAIITTDPDQTIILFNPAAEAMFGYSANQVLGKPLSQLLPERYRQSHRDVVRRFGGTGHRAMAGAARQAVTGHRANGQEFPCEVSISASGEHTNRTYTAFVRDISEREQVQQALRESEARLRRAQAVAHIGSWVLDLTHNDLQWTDEAYRIFGLPLGQKMNVEDFFASVHPDDLQGVADAWAVALRGAPYMVEHRIMRKDGQVRWVREIAELTFSATGEAIMAIGTVQDITQSKESEEALRKSTHDLGERVKELRCLYGVAELASKNGSSLPALLQNIVDTIPPAWEYPDVTCARLIVDGEEYQTAHFKETLWNLTSTISTHDGQIGTLEVYYLEAMPLSDEGPFLKEERLLIDTLAKWVGDIVERKQAEAERREIMLIQELAEQQVELGSWSFDLQTGKGNWSPHMFTLYGFAPIEGAPGFEDYLEHVHPEDRERLGIALAQMARGEAPERYEHRTNPAYGKMRILQPSYRIEKDAEGRVVKFFGTSLDITERKQAEEALRERDRRFRQVMTDVKDVVWLASLDDSVILEVNQAFEELYGLPTSAFVADPGIWIKAVHPDDREIAKASNDSLFCDGQAVVEYRIQRPDGSIRWILDRKSVLYDEQGRPVQIGGVGTDITERKLAEEALRESEENYRKLAEQLDTRVRERTAEVQDLYDNAPCGYFTSDTKGRITRINRTLAHWLGYSRKELIGRLYAEFVCWDDSTVDMDFLKTHIARGDASGMEYCLRQRNGTEFPVLVNANSLLDARGQYRGSRATVFDLTEHKRAEEQLHMQSHLLNVVGRAVIATDLNGVITYFNHAAEELYRWDAADALGRNMEEIAVVERTQEQTVEIMTELRAGRIWSGRLRIQRQDGTGFWARATTTPILDENGQISGIIGVSLDITDEMQAEETIRQTNLELERALRVKTEFLANMSHELRTPLHGILANSEILQEQIAGALNERQKKSVRAIAASGQHLLTLINDLLDLSKIDAGKLEVELQPTEIDAVCRDSLQSVQAIAHSKHMTLNYYNERPSINIPTDPVRLKQMLLNLLSNAIKFTPDGGRADLSVDIHPDTHQIAFTVQDNGIGIAAEDLPRLFEPFVQLDSSLARKHEGAGLGLPLVKQLAGLLGGEVYAESAGVPGMGSRFSIILPYTQSDDRSKAYAPGPDAVDGSVDVTPPAVGSPLVLVVEDNEVSIEVVTEYLQYYGYRVIVARSGLEAIRHAEAQSPDVILMDIQLPQLDGLEATRRLRNNPRFATTPIIALTALAMPGDRERCLQAGATEYMSKPMHLQKLAVMMEKLLQP